MWPSCLAFWQNTGKKKRVHSIKLLKVLGGIEGIEGMVNNIFEILDEGDIKKLPKVDYNMKVKNLYGLVLDKQSRTKTTKTFCDDCCDFITTEIQNDDYKEPTPRIKYAMKKYLDYQAEWDWINYPKGPNNLDNRFITWCGGEEIIYDYLDIIPFTPSVMINISPDWKAAKSKRRLKNWKIQVLKDIINNYMKEEWYDKWEYVIENGSDGSHIHAHIVAHMNVKRLKSTETHLAKGRHTKQLMKYANKMEGMEGIIKGISVQKTFLRNENLVKDKLLYLHEDTKPEGHKNKSIIEGGYVTGCL